MKNLMDVPRMRLCSCRKQAGKMVKPESHTPECPVRVMNLKARPTRMPDQVSDWAWDEGLKIYRTMVMSYTDVNGRQVYRDRPKPYYVSESLQELIAETDRGRWLREAFCEPRPRQSSFMKRLRQEMAAKHGAEKQIHEGATCVHDEIICTVPTLPVPPIQVDSVPSATARQWEGLRSPRPSTPLWDSHCGCQAGSAEPSEHQMEECPVAPVLGVHGGMRPEPVLVGPIKTWRRHAEGSNNAHEWIGTIANAYGAWSYIIVNPSELILCKPELRDLVLTAFFYPPQAPETAREKLPCDAGDPDLLVLEGRAGRPDERSRWRSR